MGFYNNKKMSTLEIQRGILKSSMFCPGYSAPMTLVACTASKFGDPHLVESSRTSELTASSLTLWSEALATDVPDAHPPEY